MYRKTSGGSKRCYHDHPALDINGMKVYGGSCINPVVTDADVYVGFDISMARHGHSYPWEKGESFLFYIKDMGVPSSVEDTKRLVEWLSVQLIAKRKVHLGCIGGHGRTGMILAALVMHMTGNKDAITYVRENYCGRAVESLEQVDFLAAHFGVHHAPVHSKTKATPAFYDHGVKSEWEANVPIKKYVGTPQLPSAVDKSLPASIWGSNVKLTNAINRV